MKRLILAGYVAPAPAGTPKPTAVIIPGLAGIWGTIKNGGAQ